MIISIFRVELLRGENATDSERDNIEKRTGYKLNMDESNNSNTYYCDKWTFLPTEKLSKSEIEQMQNKSTITEETYQELQVYCWIPRHRVGWRRDMCTFQHHRDPRP